MESLKFEFRRMFCYNLRSICHVINLGIQHHTIWKFYIQRKYLKTNLTKVLLYN